MEQMTISAVSARFEISTRTLRYWEQIGLVESERSPGSTYRVYTPEAVRRIAQILILRRMRIPLRDIAQVLSEPEAETLLGVLQKNIEQLDREAEALKAVRQSMQTLADRVGGAVRAREPVFPDDESLMALAGQIASVPNTNREEIKMDELKRAEQTLSEKMEVRYIYLPPMTVAAAQYTGENPENVAGERLDRFVDESGLAEKLPGLRVLGFNSPCPQHENETYGYEFWVTIPEDMEVPAPLEKKHFAGGLYAAHSIKMGDFHEWGTFTAYMQKSAQYEIEWGREPSAMGGSMEEHLNAKTYYEKDKKSREFMQLDLLLPIKEK